MRRPSGDLRQHAVNLQVHLIERFLDVHNVLGGHLDQTAAVTPERADTADCTRRSETGSQKTDGVKILQPLTIGDICLTPRNVLHVRRVDQVDLDPTSLQNLIDRNPEDNWSIPSQQIGLRTAGASLQEQEDLV